MHTLPHKMIVGDFNTPFSSMERSGKQKLYRDTCSIEQFILKQKNLLLSTYMVGTFSKTDNIISHKSGLDRYKKIKTIPLILTLQ